MNVTFLAAFVSAASLLLTLQAYAAATEWNEQDGARIRLIVAEPAPDATEIRAALQVELKPGWKTYWRDPGDAGVPPQINFEGSSNIASFSMAYPAPDRFDDGKSVWAGYQHPVSFPLTLKLTKAGALTRINASSFLGICDEICVPVQVNFALDVPVATGSTGDAALVGSLFDALPKAASPNFQISKALQKGSILEFELIAPVSDKSPEVFLAADGFMFGAPKLIASLKETSRYSAAIVFAPTNAKLEDLDIHYTVKSGAMAMSGETRVLAN